MDKVRLECFIPDKPSATGINAYVNGVRLRKIAYIENQNPCIGIQDDDMKKYKVEGGILLCTEFEANTELKLADNGYYTLCLK